jgi:hypothetical protein
MLVARSWALWAKDFVHQKGAGMTASFRVLCLMALVIAAGLWNGAGSADDPPKPDQPSLDPHLEPLRPLIGKTWRGVFKDSTPEKPVVDIATWERALNGQAVRVLHSINDGEYGGETIITWNADKHLLVFHYFTTAGFMTEGVMSIDGRKILSHETVTGTAGGITQIKGMSEITPEGTFVVKTEYMKESEWTPGREATYTVAPDAKVVFR